MRKRYITSFLSIVIIALCGCQKSPDNNAVISKNDGAFDISVIESVNLEEREKTIQEETALLPTENESFGFCYNDQFTSSDESVNFLMDIEEIIQNSQMPVVEVIPHFITNEDAKRIACVLFGDTDYYEAEPRFSPVYSKEEIQDKLARWTSYSGIHSEDAGFYNTVKNKLVEEYTLLMETAPISNPHIPCKWTFQKATYYYEAEENANRMDVSQDNDEIRAQVEIDNIPYLYHVSTRNKSDFKLNNIFAYPYDGNSPMGIDNYIFQSQLCRTAKPSEDDLEAVRKKAESLLKQMELGDWKIDQCYVEEFQYDIPEYIVVVKAVPSFEQVAAIRRPQLNNLKSTAIYSSNYYLTDAQFKFNMSGDLVSFELYSPVDVKTVINRNVLTLSIEELTERAKDYFVYSDYGAYGMDYDTDVIGEKLECSVIIDEIDCGLSRVKVPNTDDSYYYVPAICFAGKTEIFGKDSGNVYYSDSKPQILLILNAVDGSVINTTNE